MSQSWIEYAIIVFIVFGIVVAIWKGGSANPVGTGRLSSRVGKLTGQVGTLSTRMKHVEDEVDELKVVAATTKDIERLEQRMTAHEQLAERTWRSVRRIEEHLIEKGLNGQ